MAGEPFVVDGRWRIYNGLAAEVPLAGDTYVLMEAHGRRSTQNSSSGSTSA
jgi:hypothetical protein